MTKPAIDLVAGARPNFMKLAPVVRALQSNARIPFRIIHTGQHYDPAMTDVFFEELGIPRPHVYLEVGSGSHGAQTARIIERYESHAMSTKPAATVVFGDVNSTIACALAAVKLGIPVVHVEAGLRSFDRTMPEEINRLLTDSISELLLVSEESGITNLCNEGVPDERVRLIGNVMIDTLLMHLPAAREKRAAEKLGLADREYGVITLHRPSNVDDAATLSRLVRQFLVLARDLPLVFAVHPRSIAVAERSGISDLIAPGQDRLICLGPQPYLDTISLVSGAAVVLTDSGGLQEETSVLGVPCLTLRENTERPITVRLGTSRLVGNASDRIAAAFADVLNKAWPPGQAIPLWDGHSGERVAKELAAWMY